MEPLYRPVKPGRVEAPSFIEDYMKESLEVALTKYVMEAIENMYGDDMEDKVASINTIITLMSATVMMAYKNRFLSELQKQLINIQNGDHDE